MQSRFLATLAALSILAGSGAAAAQTAAAVDRTAAPVAEASQLDDMGGYTPWIIGLIVLGMLVYVAVELSEDNLDDIPASP
jgi:hypothetical protein